MRVVALTLILALCVFASPSDEAAAIGFVQKVVPRALEYQQGKRPTLMDAQDDFTLEGWAEFVKWLDGFIDDQGAPTGSSLFTITGETMMRSSENGVFHLAIPGTLKQQTQNPYGGISTTTYRVLVDVQIGGNPLKIQHLKTTTCGAAPCR
jgi:hypothetical protein